MRRQVKIVATLGPASLAPDVLRAMMMAGMDVARLNASHSETADLERMVSLVRRTARSLERPAGILLDLGGPKIRTGDIAGGGPVDLVPGRTVVISPDETVGTAARIGCTYEALAKDVAVGARVFIDDGLLELEVTEVGPRDVTCRVVVGGSLFPRKGINLPDTQLSLPALTEKDLRDVQTGIRLGVDYIALSFVQQAEDVRSLQRVIAAAGATVPVIAKIERPQAVEGLLGILEVSQGVMVARGDLGVEAGSHKVPLIQKRILREAGRRAVLDITATQMLDSMIRNPRPTRAEASDVANAILDGTDAVMLSGETAVGRYPVEAVAMMDRIAREVEGSAVSPASVSEDHALLGDGPAVSVARAACLIAGSDRYRTIIVLTGSGTTARLVAAYHPRAEIIALTPSEQTYHRLALVRGVHPVFLPFGVNTDAILAAGERELRRRKFLRPGEEAILVSGQLDSWGVTHLLKVFRVRTDDDAAKPMSPRVAVTEMHPRPCLDLDGPDGAQ